LLASFLPLLISPFPFPFLTSFILTLTSQSVCYLLQHARSSRDVCSRILTPSATVWVWTICSCQWTARWGHVA
jgi:hypothetical protein